MYGQPTMQAGAPYGGYGAMPMPDQGAEGLAGYGGFVKSPFARKPRPTTATNILACFGIPFMIFIAVYSLQSFSMHYEDAATEKMLCFAILGLVIMLGWVALGAWRRREDSMQDPKWYTFVFVTAAIAWVFGFVFGNKNFLVNIQPYMDVMNLNVYYGVDPATYRGQQLMDAGRFQFTEGSHLDISHSMGFKNLDTYCVAPVVSGTQSNKTSSDELPVFDFWAVGINCCSGHKPDYACGEYNSNRALSGLRLMKEGQKAYFRLAVQQAEAAYNIRAEHPIFLYWMTDPMPEIMAYQDAGYRFWLIGLGGFAGFQLVLVILAAAIFSKLGV